MSIHGILGEQTTDYPQQYSPQTLFPIARSMGRDVIGVDPRPLAVGVDWWHAFEVSWLNAQGVAQVAMARLTIPATSAFIIESKSLKLYLNSINFTTFASWDAVQALISKDLSDCLQADVEVTLFALDDAPSLLIAQPKGVCIDDALANSTQSVTISDHPNAALLRHDADSPVTTDTQTHVFHCHLLRSNCPVTNQPDWGTLGVEMTCAHPVAYDKVLRYVLSYQKHNGFHEQCVEQIFADLSAYFEPSKLMVRAWYTRRGGIDINPCRVSELDLLPEPSRLIRQ